MDKGEFCIMRFPNAYKGVSKLFYAEALAVIADILLVTTAILAFGGYGEYTASLALVAIVLAIIAFIFQMVGLHKSGKECDFHKKAFWLIILAIILSAASGSLQNINNWVQAIIGTLTSIVTLSINLLIIYGIVNLATQLREDSVASLGRLLGLAIVVLSIINIALGILNIVITKDPGGFFSFILRASDIISTSLGLIVVVGLLFYIWQGKNMLSRK